MPAYVCEEVILEFKKHNYTIFYYDINSDFAPDIESITKVIKRNHIDIFYFVVYFGFKSICSGLPRHLKNLFPDLYIIEDRAHYLSNNFIFEECDAYIYSLRKLLPVPDGGGIVTKTNLQFIYKGTLGANVFPFLMHLKRRVLNYSNNLRRSDLMKNEPSEFVKPVSYLSNKIIGNYDYQKEIELRRSLFKKWLNIIKGTQIKPVFDYLNKEDIPQGCPVFVDKAYDLHQYMAKKGYFLKIHWPLDDSFADNAPVSYKISHNIITLPIYKGITETDQEIIINLINSVIPS